MVANPKIYTTTPHNKDVHLLGPYTCQAGTGSRMWTTGHWAGKEFGLTGGLGPLSIMPSSGV